MFYDYLLIGQGLAGSTLAMQLLQTGKKVLVLDNQYPKSSSRVAAGLFNAITGHRFVKTWKADVLFPYFFNFYREMEKVLEAKFFYDLPMYRPFENIEKQNLHIAESSNLAYEGYVDRTLDSSIFDKTVFNDFGGITITKTGFLHTVDYLEAVKKYLLKNNAFIETEFIENQVVIEKDKISYPITQDGITQNICAEKIIFCRGWQDSTSILWNFLPFNLVKGEVLHVIFADTNYQNIINRGCWILPMPNKVQTDEFAQAKLHKVGATYTWDKLDENPSEEARKELCEKLEKLSRLPYKIIKQVAGIRPATTDRKPLIGQHPIHQQVYIFNGFGAKGTSLIPYFAGHFAEVLAGKVELDKEIDILRKYHKKK
jgi:glycine oxidase